MLCHSSQCYHSLFGLLTAIPKMLCHGINETSVGGLDGLTFAEPLFVISKYNKWMLGRYLHKILLSFLNKNIIFILFASPIKASHLGIIQWPLESQHPRDSNGSNWRWQCQRVLWIFFYCLYKTVSLIRDLKYMLTL